MVAHVAKEILNRAIAHVNHFTVGISDLLVEFDQVQCLALNAVSLAIDVDEDIGKGNWLCRRDADVVLTGCVILQIENNVTVVCVLLGSVHDLTHLQVT